MDNINKLKIKGHPRKQLPAEMLLGLLFFKEFFGINSNKFSKKLQANFMEYFPFHEENRPKIYSNLEKKINQFINKPDSEQKKNYEIKKKLKTWMKKMEANYIKCFMDGKMDRYYALVNFYMFTMYYIIYTMPYTMYTL